MSQNDQFHAKVRKLLTMHQTVTIVANKFIWVVIFVICNVLLIIINNNLLL